MKSIYLAGKISKNDWRDSRGRLEVVDGAVDWETIDHTIAGFKVTGPFFASCDHGCRHGESSHGVMGDSGCCGDAEQCPTYEYVRDQCLAAINRADIFFAWLDDATTAYGTLVELGYAVAAGKHIVLGVPTDLGRGSLRDVWFALVCTNDFFRADSPAEALAMTRDAHLEFASPIEEAFWCDYLSTKPGALSGLTPQYQILSYRVDFAVPDLKIAIELDGHAYHSDKETFVSDRRRQREIERMGWRFVRFAGSEVFKDVSSCVREAAAFAESLMPVTVPRQQPTSIAPPAAHARPTIGELLRKAAVTPPLHDGHVRENETLSA